jgi:hypothetical protein
MVVLQFLMAYAAAGLLVGVTFVLFGIRRALPEAGPVSAGARILVIPGAALLWPYVTWRWLTGGRAR